MRATTGLYHFVLTGHEYQQWPSSKMYFDNRIVWRQFLDLGVLSKELRGRVAPFTIMPFLIRHNIAINDGEMENEMDIKHLRHYLK